MSKIIDRAAADMRKMVRKTRTDPDIDLVAQVIKDATAQEWTQFTFTTRHRISRNAFSVLYKHYSASVFRQVGVSPEQNCYVYRASLRV